MAHVGVSSRDEYCERLIARVAPIVVCDDAARRTGVSNPREHRAFQTKVATRFLVTI